MFAFPTLLSVFYSCCIALNSQLYFVFRREPSDTEKGVKTLLKWYIFTPIVVSGIICKSRWMESVGCVDPYQFLGFCALGAGLYGYDSVYGYCWFASPPPDPDHPNQRHIRPLVGMLTTFGGWCLLALFYLLIASSTVAWVVFCKSPDVDFGGHIGLRRNRRKFTSEGAIPAPSVSSPRWTGHAATMSSTDVVIEGPEKASLTPPDDFKPMSKKIPSDIQTDNEAEAENNEQTGERDWNIHIFPPRPRYPSGVSHTRRVDAIASAPSSHQERPKISRRTLALRAMTLRLIGYILIPVICILPSSIKDLIIKAYAPGEVEVSDGISGLFDGLNGLVGLFNAILFLVDPVLLIVWAELRANHRWGRLQKQRSDAQDADHENNRAATEVDEITEFPLQDVGTPGSDGGDDQVGGIRSSRFGKEENQQSVRRAFGDSLVSGLQRLDNEQRSPRFTQAGPRLLKSMGRRKRPEAHHSGGAGLMIHVQVEVAKHSDLERVEDYLHGL